MTSTLNAYAMHSHMLKLLYSRFINLASLFLFSFFSRSNHKWFIEMKLMTDEHTDRIHCQTPCIYYVWHSFSFWPCSRLCLCLVSDKIISCQYLLLPDMLSLLSPILWWLSTPIVCSTATKNMKLDYADVLW